MMSKTNFRRYLYSALFLIILFSLTGCGLINGISEEENTSLPTSGQYEQTIPFAETVFNLSIPAEVQETMIIEVVDDTTGIELNPIRYAMEKVDKTSYRITLPLKLGSLVKYRFLLNGETPTYETSNQGEKIQYRVAYVNSAIEFYDIVSNWENQSYEYEYGRIEGNVTNAASNSPLPNLFVSAGGISTFTNSLGKFSIEGLPAGKHNLVILSTDGEYNVFQQEALVGAGLTTPAQIKVAASNFVNVTFIITPPVNHPSNAKLRILGNSYQLGNVFAGVYNGVSTIASRAPKLTELPNGKYTITLSLPAGMDLRYKYSVGDGFWNAEQTTEETFKVRQIIVPNKNTVIEDVVYAWGASNNAPVTFNVQVPEATDLNDIVSIQFNPFGWTAPIPMSKVSDNQWTFTLLGPFNLINNLSYRYCRNDACGLADDMASMGNIAEGNPLSSSPDAQVIEDVVENWYGWQPANTPTTLVAPPIVSRGSDFVTGAYLSNRYSLFEAIYADRAFQNLVDIHSNTVIIPIEWTLNTFSPVLIDPLPGTNPLWKDALSIIQKAQSRGLKVWLAPNIEIGTSALGDWNQQTISPTWQQEFTQAYGEFLVYTADLGTYMDIEGIILPTDVVHIQTITNYDDFSNTIQSATNQYFNTLKEHFSGSYYLEIADETLLDNPVTAKVDGFLVRTDLNLDVEQSSIEALQPAFSQFFDGSIYPYYEAQSKPIWIGLDYPSAAGAENGCVQFGDECIDFQILNYLNSDMQTSVSIDFVTQANLYQAALAVINQSAWVQGVVTYGFNPQVAIQDASSSVRGKPAADVLWYWNPRMLGTIK